MRRISRSICGSSTRPSRSRKICQGTASRPGSIARPRFTRWSTATKKPTPIRVSSSTRRIAFTARPATSRIRRRTLSGLRRKAGEAPTISICRRRATQPDGQRQKKQAYAHGPLTWPATEETMVGLSLREELEQRGVSRRDFLGFCASMASVLGLPGATAAIAEAVEEEPRPILVWLEFQDCAGNTESFLRASHPTVADLILDTISLNYHETLMAAAGSQAESALDQTVK